MRPRLRVVPDELVTPILAEAKRILAEIGIEVRGAPLRQRLLEQGLKLARTADDAERVRSSPWSRAPSPSTACRAWRR